MKTIVIVPLRFCVFSIILPDSKPGMHVTSIANTRVNPDKEKQQRKE